MLKNLPAVWETQVRFLVQEDPLEKEMATHPSILAWRIPWMEEPDGVQSVGLGRVGHDRATNTQHLKGMCFHRVLGNPIESCYSFTYLTKTTSILAQLVCMDEIVDNWPCCPGMLVVFSPLLSICLP